MKTLIVGKETTEIEKKIKDAGFEIVKENPEIVISYGGDGTLLHAERQYPGIPKLPMRNSRICKKCPNHEDKVLLKDLLEGKLQLKQYQKLETTIYYKKLYALNDFVIRNTEPIHTIRFEVNDKFFIGDGIIISTPFGSTGYFKSVTDKAFKTGFGVAFNNTTAKFPPLLLGGKETVSFSLKRGRATLSFDNSPDIFTIDEGSEISFKLSDQVARIYEAGSLRCSNCQVIRS